MAESESWRAIRSKLALNEARVETYRRLMDAHSEIAKLLLGGGHASEAQLDEALSASQTDDPDAVQEEAVYLSALTHYVAALGGHLEISAVFPEASVKLRELPDGDGGPSESDGRAEKEEDDQPD